ncbi:MAG: response regulator [bacterium]
MIRETKKILVVDDDQLTRIEITKCAEQQGFVVDAANNGIEALEKLKSGSPDLVLLDLLMPGLDGLEVLRRIQNHAEFKEIPVIVVSSVDDSEKVAECLQLGAIDYISKPIDIALLAKSIETVLIKAVKPETIQSETIQSETD